MEEEQIAHLAGLFDAVGGITVHVMKNDRYAIGYQYQPLLRLNRSTDDEALLGKLMAYCDEQELKYSLAETTGEKQSDSYEWTVKHPDSIVRFLEPLLPHLVSHYNEAVLMIEKIIPEVKKGRHRDRNGFYDLMDAADQLRRSSRYGTDPKYTKSHFAEEWSESLPA